MKQYIYLLLTLSIFFFNSCTDEAMEKNSTKVVEGIPVQVSLSFTREDIVKVTTRSALSEADENKVYDVRVFIFDKNEKLEYTEIFQYEDGNTAKSGIVTIPNGEITTGQKYIYAIANSQNGVGSFSKELTNIKKVSDLKELVSTLNEKTDQRLGGHLLMSGAYLEKGADISSSVEGSCIISRDVDGKTLGGEIKLSHVDSRITFNVGVKENSKITFVPKTWRVVNIPKQSYVAQSVSDCVTTYFNTKPKTFDNSTIVDTQYKGGTFSFYMYENRKEALQTPTDYNDRERQRKEDGLNKEFIYADPYATYVILTGDYSDGANISASVQYTIHLGFVNDNPSDFFSLRNTIYTYKVTVVGVHNIIVEVESSQPDKKFEENQPGAEGSVVVAEQSISVDAHYEAKNVVFKKKDLSNLSVFVSTEFNKDGKYAIDATTGEVTSVNFTDFKWVKFVKRTKSGLAKYPGDTENVTTDSKGVPTNDDGNHFLTIDQVLKQLYNNKKESSADYWQGYGDNMSVTYTAFIDEYYYKDKDWKEFVNVDNRKMHILCNTQFSYDKQSDLTTANIMISQRSIKTVYNKNITGYSTAWGIETVDETKGMPMKGGDTRTGKNGRYNTFKMLGFSKEEGNASWETYINWTSESVNKLNKKNYKRAEYACLQRNRDLNGNGKIDANEIRWYLPSTTQYTGLWLGKDALYPEARLFQKNPTLITQNTQNGGDGGSNDDFRSNNHFISSNGVRFWAEEGAATGNTEYDVTKTKFNFRCARNLEKKGFESYGVPKENDNVDDYVQPDVNNKGYVTKIDLTRLDPLALRSSKEMNLSGSPEHTGADFNRPYRKFEVLILPKNDNGKCPTGYRKPNQRELSLIAGYSTAEIPSTASCTYSDLTYKENKYYITAWKNSINIVTLSGSKNSDVLRCVKDID
ncbi:fimbrial protein [Parabacteroides faecis]|uniref:fimbrial protein n=1 Tax=Parabacteroides faecis TaxID=1217282 RepID=UPI0035222E1B